MNCDDCWYWSEWPDINVSEPWDVGYPTPRRLRTQHYPRPPARPNTP